MRMVAATLIFGCLLSLSPAIRTSALSLPLANELKTAPCKEAYNQPPGSAERKAILDALRQRMKQTSQLDLVFVVNYLKSQRGWAWIETLPKSPDGANTYENVSALMRKRGRRWTVAHLACTDSNDSNCIGNPNFFKNLRAKFPAAPRGIFPQ